MANGKYIIIINKQLYHTVRSEPYRCNKLSLSPVVHHDALIHRVFKGLNDIISADHLGTCVGSCLRM